ncbi:MAG: AraC family transcriptional regulator, partial [Pseudomonadota bacterium]|nr:AraC family transcriptional regulator [Pseudomonadota bacterium]
PGTKTIVESMMKQILVLLVRDHLQRRGLASPLFMPLYMPLSNPQLSRALTAMIERPQERHTLESLASIAGMSRSRFTHHFAAAFGRSPIDFLQLVRLRTGARLLRSSSLPIKAVAAAVGYASRSHFSRAFRSEFGVDPRSFREAQPEGALCFEELQGSAAAREGSAEIGRQLLEFARNETA